MTDVKNLTVNLKANISDFDAKLKAARASLAKGTVATEALRAGTEALYASNQKLSRSLSGVSTSAKSATNSLSNSAAATQKVAKASKIAGGEIANIGYQINDIGVMLAAGQSPFVLAMQQGTQLSQVFERLKASGKSVGKAISGALSQVMSPLSLITIGLTFAVAQSVKWFNEWRSGSAPIMSVANALKAVREEIDELDEKILRQLEGTETAAEAALRIDERRLRSKIKELEVEKETQRVLAAIGGRSRSSEVARERGLGTATRALADAQEQLKAIQTEIALLQERRELAEQLDKAYEGINETIASATIEREGYLAAERGVAEAAREEAATRANAQQALVIMGRGMEHYRNSSFKAAEAAETLAAHKKKLANDTTRLRKQAEMYERLVGFARENIDGIADSIAAAMPYADHLGRKLAAAGKAFFNAMQVTSEGPGVDPLTAFGGFGEFKYGTASRFTPDRTGGGGGGSDPLAAEFEALRERLLSQEELQLESFARQQEVLQNAYEQRLLTQQEYQNLMEEAQRQHVDALARLDHMQQQSALSGYSTLFGNLSTIFEAGGKNLVRISKAFSIAQGLINSYKAYTEVLADPSLIGRPFLRQVLAGSTLAAGLAQVANMRSVSVGGGGGGGGAGAAAASVPASTPLDVRLSGMSADEFISGASIQSLFDRLQDEAGDRGLRVSFA